MKQSLQVIPIGLAMFSMFFGAGNVIFPLAVGQYAGDQNTFAIAGMILTAVVMPFAGVFAMILYEGNYREFFGRLGKAPGFIVALLIISLIGPMGSTPRCIAVAYSTFNASFPGISSLLFSTVFIGLVFLFTAWKGRILSLLGYVLTPVLLLSLAAIVVLGLALSADLPVTDHSKMGVFFHGLKEGYNTMDLLAAFFFSSTIFAILKEKRKDSCERKHVHLSLRAAVLGAILLGVVYYCFNVISAYHGNELLSSSKDQLLSAITHKVAGSYGGVLVSVTVGLACLTTAIALVSVFSDFVHRDLFAKKVSYPVILITSLVITFAVSTLEFSGISSFLGPILQICYPGLIVLTMLNIAYKTTGFAPVKIPVFGTFALSALLFFLSK